jgi:hypothetical protein
MQKWTSVEQIASEFELSEHAANIVALRDELKKVIQSLHPDKTGGEFIDDDKKLRFLRAKEAMDFIELHSQNSAALIPVSQLPALIAAFSQAMAVRPTTDSVSLETIALNDSRIRIAKRFKLPKIGSTVFGSAALFFVTFADKFEKNTLLGPLLQTTAAQFLLAAAVLVSCYVFIVTWLREKTAEERAEFVVSEAALRDVFEEIRDLSIHSSNQGRVSSQDILRSVRHVSAFRSRRESEIYRRDNFEHMHESEIYRRHGPGRMVQALVTPNLDTAMVEKAAALQTQRLVERKLLTRIDLVSIDSWFEVNDK